MFITNALLTFITLILISVILGPMMGKKSMPSPFPNPIDSEAYFTNINNYINRQFIYIVKDWIYKKGTNKDGIPQRLVELTSFNPDDPNNFRSFAVLKIVSEMPKPIRDQFAMIVRINKENPTEYINRYVIKQLETNITYLITLATVNNDPNALKLYLDKKNYSYSNLV